MILIAGPCVVENEKMIFEIAEKLCKLQEKQGFQLIFKASYKKANRSSLNSFTGIGDEKALQILEKVKKNFHIPVLTDVHDKTEVALASQYVDYLQIPAFLCRQTELLIEAGKTGKTVNVKKGQWMSAESMSLAVEKTKSPANAEVWLTERGTIFGYNDLVVDFTSVPKMKKICDKVIVDCTHSVQKPNAGLTTGGDPSMIETIAKAAVAVGADGLFLEVHPNPEKAMSDAASMLQIDKLENIISKCLLIINALK